MIESLDRTWAIRILGVAWLLGAAGLVAADEVATVDGGSQPPTLVFAIAAAGIGVILIAGRTENLRDGTFDALLLAMTTASGATAVVYPAEGTSLTVSVLLAVPFACALLPTWRAWIQIVYFVVVHAVVMVVTVRIGDATLETSLSHWLQLSVTVVIVGLVARRLGAQLGHRTRVADSVAKLGHRALSVSEPDALLSQALHVAVDVVGSDYGTALRQLPDGRMRVVAELGPHPLTPGSILPGAAKDSYAEFIMQSGQAFVSTDLRVDPRITPPEPLLRRGVVSGLAVPVLGSQGPLGVLAMHFRRRRRFTRYEVAAATALAGVVATAWEHAEQRAKISHQAMHDGLTGLPNRSLFLDRLELALSRRAPHGSQVPGGVTVMLIDLDDFKRVNDSLGHHAGDELLIAVAKRFLDAVRPEDTVARIGGDEFAVLCEQALDEHTATRLLQRLQAATTDPVVVADSRVQVTASIGVALRRHPSSEPPTARALLGEADAALYMSKQDGRGQSRLFDERLQRQARHRSQLESDIRRGIDNGEFLVHYQPIRSLDDQTVLGVEALVRWQHPERGLVGPDQFIPVAEQTGLIVPLGQWVLHTACAQVARWQQRQQHRQPGRLEPLRLAVNVSPRQLDDPTLARQVEADLRLTNLAAGSLSLELTETALLEDGTGIEALTALREAGAELVLDDFGTGFSSLTHLTRFPIAAVKIDRSFVAGLGTSKRDSAVVYAVIALGAELDMRVVAEGVETPEQLALLRQTTCYGVQGFLLDRPSQHPALDPIAFPGRLDPLPLGAGHTPATGRPPRQQRRTLGPADPTRDPTQTGTS